MRQGEQLDNIESKVTDVDKNLTTTQKHLNSIKSVFGGMKNWWSSKKDEPTNSPDGADRPSRLKDVVESNPTGFSGASVGPRGVTDTSGFGDDDDLDSRFMARARKPVQSPSFGESKDQQYIQPITGSSREDEMNENFGKLFGCCNCSRFSENETY